MSSSIDSKIRDLENTNTDMQNLQFDVKRFKATLGDISNRYDILEKKNEIIEKTVADVDKAFDNLKDIERRLENCNRSTADFPTKITGLKSDVDKILENIPRVKDAIDKLDSLDGILSSSERRFEILKDDEEWLAKTEKRLDQLNKDVTGKLRTLGEVSKSSTTRLPGTKNSATAPGTRESVITLAHQGWTPETIANRLGLTIGEVELILGTQ